MEVPSKLKSLYKHWGKHSNYKTDPSETKIKTPQELEYFISERMKIWEKKWKDEKPPYTEDKILQNFRFCNIYRELDKQTIDIHEDLKPLEKDFPLWLLNLAFHRFVCNPKTVKKVGRLSFDKKVMKVFIND